MTTISDWIGKLHIKRIISILVALGLGGAALALQSYELIDSNTSEPMIFLGGVVVGRNLNLFKKESITPEEQEEVVKQIERVDGLINIIENIDVMKTIEDEVNDIV